MDEIFLTEIFLKTITSNSGQYQNNQLLPPTMEEDVKPSVVKYRSKKTHNSSLMTKVVIWNSTVFSRESFHRIKFYIVIFFFKPLLFTLRNLLKQRITVSVLSLNCLSLKLFNRYIIF